MNSITNFLFNSKIKRFFIIIFLLILYIFICANSYANAVCVNIAESVFRLHVIANSDSTQDQELKYLVRDEIIKYINEVSIDASSKDEVMQFAKNNLETLQNIALNTIHSNGYDYSVKVSIGNFAFPSKQYGDIILPPGYYDALKIEIGEAKGQNWWCVMFPPLCFVDVSSGIVPEDSKETMKNNLSQEEYSLISQSDTDFKFKFKIVEVLQNFSISGIFM